MQNAFLIVSKNYTEKQAGVLFVVFGLSQFLFQTPAGYMMDYTNKKTAVLSAACIATSFLTILTALTAQEEGGNIGFMIVIKFFQGVVTAFIPPGLNSITQGIVGSVGMTKQVSRNEMMNHFGTAVIVLAGSLIAYFLYPDIGILFAVSAVACLGVVFFLNMIRPQDIDHDAARGLIDTSKTDTDTICSTPTGYKPPVNDADGESTEAKKSKSDAPSFNFGFGGRNTESFSSTPHAETPLNVLRDPILLTFVVMCFLFHLANASILPLVMQTLAIGEGRSGILMSGLCIIVSQTIMVGSAKLCGDYSTVYGRKPLFLVGLFSLSVRCLLLVILLTLRDANGHSTVLQVCILSTQLLDGVGAGFFGTMYILVTSDISRGSGRFSMTLGITTAAMSIGGTVSGYLGQALAEDKGYREAFGILGFIGLVPALLYLFCIPETFSAEELGGNRNTMTGIAEENEENHDDKSEDQQNDYKSMEMI
uniref:Major facilitator superfamily (MFS) profile domain-containing protein n=1 Tax=Ditylum brightwellii TaxID=49249 RepID=A0A6V2FNH2_9STRA|mmetsp:Transcript_3430/g.5293  ORF Transcript_3430/g.5293 Transcript_3430/m.5293 type:complete len:479 (+) Transcript_3430:382-1818(+)